MTLTLDDEWLEELKFGQCLPRDMVQTMMTARLTDEKALRAMLG